MRADPSSWIIPLMDSMDSLPIALPSPQRPSGPRLPAGTSCDQRQSCYVGDNPGVRISPSQVSRRGRYTHRGPVAQIGPGKRVFMRCGWKRETPFRQRQVRRIIYRPFDVRYLYWEPETKLLDEKREEYLGGYRGGIAIVLPKQSRTGNSGPFVAHSLVDLNSVDGGANILADEVVDWTNLHGTQIRAAIIAA